MCSWLALGGMVQSQISLLSSSFSTLGCSCSESRVDISPLSPFKASLLFGLLLLSLLRLVKPTRLCVMLCRRDNNDGADRRCNSTKASPVPQQQSHDTNIIRIDFIWVLYADLQGTKDAWGCGEGPKEDRSARLKNDTRLRFAKKIRAKHDVKDSTTGSYP